MSSRPSQIGASAGKVKRDLWLSGDVLACACPDCGGPMSVRVWLMMADCPSCAASIELTAEQRRQAERLMGQRLEAAKPAVPSVPPPSFQASSPVKPPPAAPAKKPHIPVAKLVKTGPSIPPPLPPPSPAPPRQPPPLPPTISRSLARSLKHPRPSHGGSRRPYWTIALLSLCAMGAAYALWSLLRWGDNSTSIDVNRTVGAAPKQPLRPSKWQ